MYGKKFVLLVAGVFFGGGLIIGWFPNPDRKQESSYHIVRMKATAYCPCKKCCGKFADGKTAIGADAWEATGVAADPKLLPYGTKLDIPGIGIRTVDDTGSAMKQSSKKGIYHIDVRIGDHKKALKFGVKWLDVKVLK